MNDAPSDKATRIDAQTLFEKLFASSPDAILVTDAEGWIIEANPQVEGLFGYGCSELLAHAIEMLIPERFRKDHPRHRADYSHEPRMRPMGAGLELYGRRKDGTEFPVDIMLSPAETASGKIILSVVRDISERKRAEESQRRSEQQFRSLFEFSPDAIIASDPDGRITQVNARVMSLFGYSQPDLLGQPVEILIPERFRRAHPQHRADYSKQARVRPMGIGLELYARRKDGSEFPVDIMLSPLEADKGGTITVVRDLSERLRYEEALKRTEEEKRYLEDELENRFDDIIGESVGLRRVLKEAETVASTDATVLILGETGTGKELIARAIHRLSSRRERNIIRINCAAIPGGLLESELFGHEKGAFTGAITQKIGRLELAHQGTLFLDEVGDIPLELQPKLLRALQEKEFERLGSTRTISADVRLIAATNQDLGKMVADKQFRSDLYYRLRVFPITIPPLRERREDIPLLVRYFVDRHARRLGRTITSIPADAMEALTKWDWPGNIRELENLMERAVILSKGPALRVSLSELAVPGPEPQPATATTSLEETERAYILRILRETKGLIGGTDGAASRLNLKRTTLNSKMKKLGIERKDYI